MRVAAQKAAWYRRHRAERREKSRLYYQKNKEKLKAANKKWAETHREKMREYNVKYRATHPKDKEESRSSFKVWLENNREYNRERHATWRKRNADRLNQYRRERYKTPTVKRANKNSILKRQFGITLADYEAMLKRQDGLCAICNHPPVKGQGKCLVVDHDHLTGKVRDLLCSACNTALGGFGEEKGRLANAIAYLQKHGR